MRLRVEFGSMNNPVKRDINLKTAVLVTLLVPLNCFWVLASTLRAGTSPTQVSLFFNAIGTVLILFGIGIFIRWISPRLALNRTELIVIYVCVSLGSAIAGGDRMYVFVPLLGHAHRFATPENDWGDLFLRYVPSWLTVNDNRVLDEYYKGFSSLYTAENLRVWIPIILWWGAFIIALHFVMLCINTIIRRQWVDAERLSYPIIQLPLEMTHEDASLFKSRMLWLGFGIAATIDIINGLHAIYPIVPSLGGRLYNMAPLFTEKPFNAIGWTPLAVFPFAVGMAFFIPLDLSYSCWVFWILWRVERILGAAIGLRALPRFPYEPEQSHGAYLGLCVLALWMSRKHLKAVFSKVFRRMSHIDDSLEPMPYRAAFLGIIAGSGFILFFCSKAGMSAWVVVSFFVIWLMLALAITRMRAELGSPVHDLHFIGPDETLPRMFGTRRLGANNLTMFSYLYFLNRAHRAHVMPHQLEGFKLAERASINNRRLFALMVWATVLGAFASFFSYLTIAYRQGGLYWTGNEAFGRLEKWLTLPRSTDTPALIFIGVGFILTLLLASMRMQFLWWSLHPAAYAVTGSWAINPLLGSIFVGWLCKWLVLKYGGIKWLRNVTPAFLGLILGEFVVGGFWSILGTILGRPMYRFLF